MRTTSNHDHPPRKLNTVRAKGPSIRSFGDSESERRGRGRLHRALDWHGCRVGNPTSSKFARKTPGDNTTRVWTQGTPPDAQTTPTTYNYTTIYANARAFPSECADRTALLDWRSGRHDPASSLLSRSLVPTSSAHSKMRQAEATLTITNGPAPFTSAQAWRS